MREILIRHWEHYPRMEAQDLVKLIYQSEFGGGHLIRDPGESLRRLQAEYEAREWERQGRRTERWRRPVRMDGSMWNRLGAGCAASSWRLWIWGLRR